MQKPIRRTDRAIDSEESASLLSRETYGILSTVGSDGKPYAVPLSYIYRNGAIYIHCAREGRKLDNIAANSAVSFCVVGQTRTLPRQFSTEYESTIVSGNASPVHGDEKREALVGILEKYSPDFMESGLKYLAGKLEQVAVIRIDIDHISGKARRA